MKRRLMIAAAIIGGVLAVWYYLALPPPVDIRRRDETPAAIEAGKAEIQVISRDIEIHNIETVREVRIIRETMAKSVADLEPDELVRSIDEFISRWRESAADKLPPGSPRLDR